MPIVRRTQLAPAVQPYIYVASDTVLTDRYGTTVPLDTYVAAVEASFLEIAKWMWDTLDGWTFDLLPAVVFRDSRSEATLLGIYDGQNVGMWLDTMGAAHDAGRIYRDSPLRSYYLVTPLYNSAGGSLAANYYGAPFLLPGTSCSDGKVARALGGITPQFQALSTLTNSPGLAGTSLTITPGDGTKFAAAAGHPYTTVATPPSPAVSGNSLIVQSTYGDDFPAAPFDAVVWQAGTGNPTLATAEAIRVTGKSGGGTNDTFTITRNIDGTTARTIVGGGSTSADRIWVRNTRARVWSASDEPEDAGYEDVIITGYASGTLTVDRAEFGTAARNIVAGDRIAVLDPEGLLAQSFASGAVAHEMGHAFRDDGVHPASGIMSGSWAAFPNVGWFSEAEKTGMRQCRVMFPRTARPGGPGGPGPGGGGGSSDYKVQPVIWWASDTETDATIFDPAYGFPVPFDDATFRTNVDANVLWTRRWFWDNFDGYTFDAEPAVMYVSPQTKAQVLTSYPGLDLWHRGLYDADQAIPAIDVTDPKRIHAFLTPMENAQSELGPSVMGRCENIRDFTLYGINADTPFQCGVWSGLRKVGRDIGGAINQGVGIGASTPVSYGGDGYGAHLVWSNDTYAGLAADYAAGYLAHELGHAFGYQLSNPPPSYVYPHDSTYQVSAGRYNLMDPVVHHLQAMTPTADQKTVFKLSPFMSHYATRP